MDVRKKRPGDRFDGYWLKDEAPPLAQFMAYLMPGRVNNEAYIADEIETTAMDAYLAKKNEGREKDKYTYFHVFLAATVKCFVLRPRMNRFIAGNRVYQRNHISVSFVVKKRFADNSGEALAYKIYDKNDTIDTLHESILEEIYQCRREDVLDNSTDVMAKLIRLPRWLLRFVINVLFALDANGKVPNELIKADPNYSSIFFTNLGSIGMRSGYHHLNNWGTNSFFCTLGKRRFAPEWYEDGSYKVRPVIGLGMTVDERIGDGYYYSESLRLMHKIMENPEILEQPFSTPVEY